jgi:REP element-mobilizing transposase RayT
MRCEDSAQLGVPRIGFTRGLLGWLGHGEESEALLWARRSTFVTFSCYRRIPLLRTIGARNVFVKALGAIRDRYKFSLVGYVVMPEHVHLLLSEPPKSTPSI